MAKVPLRQQCSQNTVSGHESCRLRQPRVSVPAISALFINEETVGP